MIDQFKFASWNLEWADKLIDVLDGPDGPKKDLAGRRADAIVQEISLVAPDLLLICEGPRGEARAQPFFARVAPGYDLVAWGDASGDAYRTQGRQWIWFLVRRGFPATCSLLNLDRWVDYTSEASFGSYGEEWFVGMPRFVRSNGTLLFEPEVKHKHYRHPQVLQVDLEGFRFEIIGAHLKSKRINLSTPAGVGTPGFFRDNPEFVSEVVEARIKLTTEATDIRYYIDERFKMDTRAPIIVAGDMNDGPGKELIEERFLLHDLIGNLQGEVFFARAFLNHALFDFAEEERWSVQFRDVLDPRRPSEILLDHILFTQSFVGADDAPGATPFRAPAGGGRVEHDAHHTANAGVPSSARTSDHRPVSMRFVRRPNL